MTSCYKCSTRSIRRTAAAGFDFPTNAQGIDISQAQTPLDWNAVKEAGYSYAIIRATQGKADSRPVGADTGFRGHIDAALAAGMDVGVYHNFIPSIEGAPQAEFFLGTVAPYLARLSFPLAIDVELDSGQSPDVIASRLHDLCIRLEALTGQKPMIYTSPGFWNGYVGKQWDAYFATLPLWTAHWSTAPQPLLPRCWSTWQIWQHEVRAGGIAGYPKRLDLNRIPGAALVPIPEPFFLGYPVETPEGCQIVVTSKFGVPRDYDGDGIKDDWHEGTDFAPVGNVCLPNIVACADGVVESVRTIGAYGNRIKIKHVVGADIYYTWYCHLSVMEVANGARVRRGQIIGVMGSTGNSTGVHLHLNLVHVGHGLSGFVVDDVVDPEDYLPK